MHKIELKNLESHLEKIDVFICSASYEERCFSVANQLVEFDIQHKIIFDVVDLENIIIRNAHKLAELLGKDTSIVNLSISNPADSLSSMDLALSNIFPESVADHEPKNYLIDITTFTREGLLMLLKLLKIRLKDKDRLLLCYSSAKEYSFNESDNDKKWLSKGVKSVRSILGYPGLLDPSKKNHLIILFGFERQRTKQLIDIFDYDDVTLAFGSKEASISYVHQELNECRFEDLSRLYPNVNKLAISLIDPYDTKEQLLSYIEKFGDYNTVIAPMSNKISAIGAGLAATENQDIQLCYAPANLYNIDGYSLPGEDCYLFEIKL